MLYIHMLFSIQSLSIKALWHISRNSMYNVFIGALYYYQLDTLIIVSG